VLYDPKWNPVEVKLEPWQKILLKAADLLERQGWCQEKLTDRGSHCTIGALQRVAFGTALSSEWDKLSSLVRDSINYKSYMIACTNLSTAIDEPSIWDWNDNCETTASLVVSTLRKVAQG